MQRKTTLLVALLAVCFLFVGAAQAQVVYQITSTPTFVINTGRAEVLGDVRITPIGPAAPLTISGTAEYLYENIGCDNDTTNGITLNATGVYFGTAAIAGVTNTPAGCVVAVTIPGGLAPALTGADFIEVRGVRGRVDLSPGSTPGTDINVRLNASPSTSMLFTAPSIVRVATSAVGLIVAIRTGVNLVCVGTTTTPRIRVIEGFNTAFVQHVPAPLNARPIAGGLNNTQIRIVLADIPVGVTISFPAGPIASVNIITGAAGNGSLTLISSSATEAVYNFLTSDQALSDIQREQFDIFPTITPTPLPAGTAGAGTAQVRLWPGLVTGDATSVSTVPFGATAPSGVGTPVSKPRFNDPFQPTPAANLFVVSPCTTNLLFPWLANIVGFDSGIAIANTSSDPFDPLLSSANRTVRQSGTCTLTGWRANDATTVSFTTPNIPTGTTFTMVLSGAANPMFNGFAGYVIARCNFQYAHAFAFLQDGVGLPAPRLAEGYVALVIPDPVIMVRRNATNSCLPVGPFAVATAAAAFPIPTVSISSDCVANAGEGLNQ